MTQANMLTTGTVEIQGNGSGLGHQRNHCALPSFQSLGSQMPSLQAFMHTQWL